MLYNITISIVHIYVYIKKKELRSVISDSKLRDVPSGNQQPMEIFRRLWAKRSVPL